MSNLNLRHIYIKNIFLPEPLWVQSYQKEVIVSDETADVVDVVYVNM
jgi:hypothetical protein